MISTDLQRVQIQDVVESQLPSFVRDDFPLVGEFLKQYYVSQEYPGASVDLLNNIDQYLKLESLTSNRDTTKTSAAISISDDVINVKFDLDKGIYGTYEFPEKNGLIKIGNEIILYTGKTSSSFTGCVRGFSGVTSYHHLDKADKLTFSTSEIDEHPTDSTVTNLSALFLNQFLIKIKRQFSPGFDERELDSDVNERLFISESSSFYKSKGTDNSFKILFSALYGEPVEVIRPSEYLFRPSDADYRVTKDLVVDFISATGTDIDSSKRTPLNIENQTLFQDNYTNVAIGTDGKANYNIKGASATITNVEKLFLGGKDYWKLSLDFGYSKDITFDGSVFGTFSVDPKTKLVNTVSAGSTVLDVDSTVGFPDSGELVVTYSVDSTGIVTYTDKTVNQFLSVDGVTNTVTRTNDVRLNSSAYAYVGIGTTTRVDVRIGSVLSDVIIDPPETYYYVDNDTAKIKSLGITTDSARTSSLLYNISPTFEVESFELTDTSNLTYKITTKVPNGFTLNTRILVIADTEVEADILSVTDSRTFTVRTGTTLAPSNVITIQRVTTTAQITPTLISSLGYLENYTTGISNAYVAFDHDVLVASSSLPYYPNSPLDPQDRQITLTGTYEGETFLVYGNGYYTGDCVYYKKNITESTVAGSVVETISGFSNMAEGPYFIKKIDNNNFKLATSQANLANDNFVSVSGIVTSNTLTAIEFLNKKVDNQRLIRQLASPNDESGTYVTDSGKTGILINGVEILNYKSENSVYYGELEKINVSSFGSNYDIINPPDLVINDSVGTGATGVCNVRGSLDRIEIIDAGFDYVEKPIITITGGNGVGAKADINTSFIIHAPSFNAADPIKTGISTNTIGFSTYHKFRNAEQIIYRTEGQNAIAGIVTDSRYYVRTIDAHTVSLHPTEADAIANTNTQDLTALGGGIQRLQSVDKKQIISNIFIENAGSNYANKCRKIGIAGVNTASNYINIPDHQYASGEFVRYNYTDTAIAGLSSDISYVVTTIDNDNFALSNVGVGTTTQFFYYDTKQYIDFTSTGSGTHSFNYEPISVSVVGKIGVTTFTDQNFNAVVQPIFRGSLQSVQVTDKGVGYGTSEIINFDRQPYISLFSGSDAELLPIINNGAVQEVLVTKPGSGYNSPPTLVVSGEGSNCVLVPVLENGEISKVVVSNSGTGYTDDTSVTITAAGSGAVFNSTIQEWNINLYQKYFNIFTDDDGVLSPGLNEDYGIEYTHLYAPRNLRESIFGRTQENVIKYGTPDLNKIDDLEVGSKYHSPIIGWAYDGNPIYGPYGYSTPTGGSVRAMVSGYESQTLSNRPEAFDSGFFVEDFVFTNSGDLDEHNGRFCITPDYPNGVYAYFATINSIVDSSGPFKGYKAPEFPYLIGNTFKSKPNQFNFEFTSNQSKYDLNTSEYFRNTTPYKFNTAGVTYNYVFDPDSVREQTVNINDTRKGEIQSVGILTGGQGYQVGDKIEFESIANIPLSEAQARVSKVGGKVVDAVSVASSTLSSVEIVPFGSNIPNQYVAFSTDSNHFKDQDFVNISGINTSTSYLNGSFTAGITSSLFTLTTAVSDTDTTGIVTYFNISGQILNDIFNIRENDILKIEDERVKVLNVDSLNSRIRVLRSIEGTVSAAHTASTLILEDTRKFKFTAKESENDVIFNLNKEIYFNPLESLGIGTESGVGIGTTISFSNAGAGKTELFLKTRSIYLPDHELNTGDTLSYESNGGDLIGVSTLGVGNTFHLSGTVYVAKITKDLIGVSTVVVGLGTTGSYVGVADTTANDRLLYLVGLGTGVQHSFTTVKKNVVTAEVNKNIVTVSTASTHGLSLKDTVYVDNAPGVTTSVVVKYNEYNRRIVFDPKDFVAGDVDTTDNTITITDHGLQTADKIIHTASTPSGGLADQKIYYVFRFSKNKIKLCNTSYEATSFTPIVVDITSASAGTISPINPSLDAYRNDTLTFDLSDSSLSFDVSGVNYASFTFNLYSDNDLVNKFESTEASNTFEVSKVGTIGISTNAGLTLKIQNEVPKRLYYKFDPVKVSFIPEAQKQIIIDTEVPNYNEIQIRGSVYSGTYNIISTASTSFTYTTKEVPERSSYTQSNTIISYQTDSTTAYGPISDIEFQYKGHGYPYIVGVSTIVGIETNPIRSGAILKPSSTNIGSIVDTTIENIGFDYPTDNTLRPTLNLPEVVLVDPLVGFTEIGITSAGRNYTIAPDLVVLDGLTGKEVDVDLTYEIGDTDVTILKNTTGINNVQPTILPTNNSNGIEINSITYDISTQNVTVGLSTAFSGTSPLAVGDKILIEGVSVGVGTTGNGYNSSQYEYRLFTLADVNIPLGGSVGVVTYSLDGFLAEGKIPGNYDANNSSPRLIPEKYFPQFKSTLKNNTFLKGEVVTSGNKVGIVENWNDQIELMKISTEYEFDIGDIIVGRTSNTTSTITEKVDFNAECKLDSSSIVKQGWKKETGFLNYNTERLPDNNYYQQLSYALKSKVSYEDWNDAVSALAHPAGLIKFSDHIVETKDDSFRGVFTRPGGATVDIITDIPAVMNVKCFDAFDLVAENSITIDDVQTSNEIYFSNKILTDYYESIGNRVLTIDDVSTSFNDDPRSTRYSVVGNVNASQRTNKFFTFVRDRRYTDQRQGMMVSILQDGTRTYLSQYGRVDSVYNIGSFDFQILGSEGQLTFYPTQYSVNNYNVSFVNMGIDNTVTGIGSTELGDVARLESFQQSGFNSATNIVSVASSYRSIKLMVEIDNDSGKIEFDEVSLLHDGTDVNFLEYGQLTNEDFALSGSSGLGTYGATISSGIVNLSFTPNAGTACTANSFGILIPNSSGGGVGNTISLGNLDENMGRLDSHQTTISASGTPGIHTIASYPHSGDTDFSSAYYVVSIEDTTNSKYQLSEVITLNDSTQSYITEYGTLTTDVGIGTIGVLRDSDYTNLQYTPPASTAVQVRVFQLAAEQVTTVASGGAEVDLNNALITSAYGFYNGTDTNVLKAFTLRHRERDIFKRDVDLSNTDVIDITNNSITIPEHFFITGEEILYTYDSATPIGIATTSFAGIGSTAFLPTHEVPLYAIKTDSKTLKIAQTAEDALASTPVPLDLTSVGVGTFHTFTARNQNSKCLIALDNMIQTPIVETTVTSGLSTTAALADDIVTLTGITSFFGGDLIKVDEEIMKISTVGYGTTNSLLVNREWMGTTLAIHTGGATVTKVTGAFNIVDNTINFYEAPQGPTPISSTTNAPDDRDWVGITTFSTFQGRVFLRSGVEGGADRTYKTNYIFDDISGGFNATTKTFTLKSEGTNVSGFKTDNAAVLIKGIFQSPTGQLSTDQDYTLSEGSGISSITFTGTATSLTSDVNNANIPIGGVIVSVGSTDGWGYQPLVAAGGTALVSSAGTITSVSIGNSGSGYRVGVQTVHVGIQTFSTGLPNITGIGTAQIENGHITGVAVTNGQVFYITRDVSNVGYTSITGITTITTSSAHELNIGDEVILSGIALTCEYAPAVAISTVDYNNTAGIMTVTTSSAHGLATTGKSSFVILSGIGMTCDLDAGVGVHTYPRTTDPYYTGSPVTAVNSTTEFVIPVGVSTVPTFHKTGGFVIPAIRAPRTANFSTSGTDPAAGGTPVTKVIDSTSFVVNSGVSTRGHLYARGGTVTKPLDIVFDDPLSYSNIPLIYSSDSPGGTGVGTTAVVNVVVGQGSSVINFQITNTGYGYGQNQILTIPTGGDTGIPLNTNLTFREFQITIEKVDNDSFAAWHFGELQVLDLIQDQFDGVKKSFTLKSNSVPVTIRASDGSNIDVQSTLLVFLNDILQVPGEGFTLVGGSTLTFPSAPKGPIDTGFGGDTCKVLFYKGSGGVDVIFKDVLETVKKGDTLQLKDQNARLVTEVFATDSTRTNAYTGAGISGDPDNERAVSWCKQTFDKVVGGQVVSKSREEYEPLIYPTTFIIQPVGVSSDIAFVESVKTFFDSDKENESTTNTQKITITSQDNIVGASATAVVSTAGTVSSVVVSYGGTGYTSAPAVAIADPVGSGISVPKTTYVNGQDIPVGLGTTATATATLTGDAVSAITVSIGGSGYTSTTPPEVVIQIPNSISETNTSDSYTGDFGSIVGLTSTSVGVASTGYVFDMFIPIDSYLRDADIVGSAVTVSGIQTGYYFVVNNSNVGSGVTSLYQDNTVLGITTQFLDSVYEVAAVSTATTAVAGVGITYVRRVTVSVSDLGNISGIGNTEFYGEYSWGRIDLGTRVSAQAFNAYTLKGTVGITTSAVITRTQPLKYKNYS